MQGSPRSGLLAAPYVLWLLAAFAAPLGAVALLSVQDSTEMFAPLEWVPSATQYREILGDAFFRRLLLNTGLLGLAVAAVSALLAYPMALWLTRLSPRAKPFGFAIILVPLLTNVVVRSLGIILLLAPHGVVSGIVQMLGFAPVNLLFGWFAVGVSLVQVFLPFMVLALYDVLEAQERRLEEAAAGLGAGPAMRFWRVTFPLSLPGLRGGLTLVFLMASTAYVSATLVGGRKVLVTGMVVLREGMEILNYPLASALAILMLATSVLVTLVIARAVGGLTPWISGRVPRRGPGLPPALRRALVRVAEALAPIVYPLLLGAGIFVLMFPLLLVAVASVNDSPQATVAQFIGFTWKWYGRVLQSERYLSDAWTSLRLALACVGISLCLALPAAFALVRGGFRGKEALGAFLMLPLALPGIAIGLGMLRLLQWFNQVPPFVGVLAVHVVLVTPFMLALLRASVAQLDIGLEEAAGGLGATGPKVFRRVILPQLAPGIVVACVIGFLMSFGEVTVTAFLTTARLQTLPVRIYAEATFSLENTVNAISTIFILVTVALLVLVNRLMPLDRVWKR